MQTLLHKLSHIALAFLVFVYIIFEELVWETLAKPIYNFVHSLKILQKVEVLIHKLHRLVLLIIFLTLFVQVELLGFVAVALFAKGQVYSGVLLYMGKIPVGAFTFWLFNISKDKLMTFGWFKSSYEYIMYLIEKIKASQIYQDIKTKSKNIKKYFKDQSKVFKNKFFQKNGNIKEKIKKIYQSIKKIFK